MGYQSPAWNSVTAAPWQRQREHRTAFVGGEYQMARPSSFRLSCRNARHNDRAVQQRVGTDEVRVPSAGRPSPLNPVFGGSRDASRYGGPSLDVGARIGPMDPGKYLSGMGPRPEEARATLGTLACRYDAVDEAQTYRSERLHRAASDRQAHNPRRSSNSAGWIGHARLEISGASRGDCWAAPRLWGQVAWRGPRSRLVDSRLTATA